MKTLPNSPEKSDSSGPLDKFNLAIESLPTTNLRFLLSALAYVGTAVAVLGFRQTLPESFLWFLLAWSGLDVGQYGLKRMTFQPPAS